MRAKKPKIKCLFVALVVLTLAGGVVSATTASQLVVKLYGISPGNYKIIHEGTFNLIQMKGFATTESPGDPMLPHKIQDILLPADVLESTVKLNIVSTQKCILDGTYDIKPTGPAVAWVDGRWAEVWGNKNIVNGRNIDVYQKDADYPASPVNLLCCSQMRKWKFIRVDFSPFQYNPVSKKLTLIESVEIEISYEKSPVVLDAALMNDKVRDDDIAAERFLNYNEAKGWYEQAMPLDQPSQQTHDYVIITTNAINTGSNKLSSFVTHKEGLGHSVLVVTYENSIQGLTGQAPNNRAEKIRQWLINNYVSEGIKYVLLIGDPHPFESGEGDIPMKMCHPERNQTNSDVAQTPTDYFYADLTGNWDIDADQFYGEWHDPNVGSGDYPVPGGVDFTPEVYVGRIPVYDVNYTLLDSILQKIIDYESDSGNINWRTNTLLPMGFQDTGYDGAPLAEQMQDDYLDIAGYSSWRMYQQGTAYPSDDSSYPSDEELRGSPSVPNVLNRWSGAGTPAAPNDFGIVCWWAHGGTTSAIVGYGTGNQDGTLFQSSYCSSLDNNHPAFTYQCSCNNGYPENNNNLQYAILKQGGIGTVGATRLSFFNFSVGYGQFDGSVTNSGIGYEYVARLVQNLRAGDSLYLAKSSMSPNANQCWLMNWYDFNLYGDPSLRIGISNPVKWLQRPDTTETGGDIRCDRGDFEIKLADDFNCTRTGPITKVTLWGSWKDDIKGKINKIHLSIYNNDPCGPAGWDMPNELLWERDFFAADIDEIFYGDYELEWFLDPIGVYDDRNHYGIWQYDIYIDSFDAFVQQGDPCNPIIYWLSAWVELEPDSNNPMFGWKTSLEKWNNDAVYTIEGGNFWFLLLYPCDPRPSDYVDLAFMITTEPPLYVDENVPVGGDGSSWASAYKYLQDALTAPHAFEIFVADGTYKPDQGAGQTPGDRNASFKLKNGMRVYGGYAGYGAPDPNARDIELYETILSGDLAGNDTDVNDPCDLLTDSCRAENSYHVVDGSNTNATTILDGFTITAGDANGAGWPNRHGGGMFNFQASCRVNQCTFIENSSIYGGAMCGNTGSDLCITNCTFIRNAAMNNGGGIDFYTSNNPVITECVFIENVGVQNGGAGMSIVDSNSPTITNCRFISNKGLASGSNGGGFYNVNSHPKVMNCLFTSNSADYGGAVSNINGSSPTITNCTFSSNRAHTCDGGIHNDNNSFPTINNCILWDNTSLQIGDSGGSAATVNYSDVQGGWTGAGVGNIDADPCFVARIAGMISYWKFDEGSGTIANDSVSGNNGTISSATWTTGKVGPALYFSSSDVTVPHSSNLDIIYPFTVEAWIKAEGIYNYHMIVDKLLGGATSYGFSFYLSGGSLKLSLYSGANGNGSVAGTTDLRDDTWHHVVGFWDGSHIKIYIDGGFEAESPWAYPPGSTTNNLGIGKRLSCYGGCLYFTGSIDEVAIYNRVLDITEIQQHYRNGLAGYGYKDMLEDYHLQHNSPCIDVGNNNSVPPGITTDLDSRLRFIDGDCNDTVIVDMGAYEFAYAYIGDFDADCDVDFYDYTIFANAWLQNVPLVDIYPPPAGDSIVDFWDLDVLCKNWLAGVE